MKTAKTILMALTAFGFAQQANSQTKDTAKHKIADQIPFDGIDQTWVNGNDRRDSSIFHIPYFSPEILLDANATYSFANPIDHTVVGSTALARDNEIQISQLGFGGDFNYDNVHGRFMTQFGTRDEVVPRNDYSTYRGQYDLQDAYRYISEAYGGYHFNVWHGINVDAKALILLSDDYVTANDNFQAKQTLNTVIENATDTTNVNMAKRKLEVIQDKEKNAAPKPIQQDMVIPFSTDSTKYKDLFKQ